MGKDFKIENFKGDLRELNEVIKKRTPVSKISIGDTEMTKEDYKTFRDNLLDKYNSQLKNKRSIK